MSGMKPFPASEAWLHRFRIRFGLKNVRITEVAAAANEEAAATFLAELKSDEGLYCLQLQHPAPGGPWKVPAVGKGRNTGVVIEL